MGLRKRCSICPIPGGTDSYSNFQRLHAAIRKKQSRSNAAFANFFLLKKRLKKIYELLRDDHFKNRPLSRCRLQLKRTCKLFYEVLHKRETKTKPLLAIGAVVG